MGHRCMAFLAGALLGLGGTVELAGAPQLSDRETREAIVALKTAVVRAYITKDAATLDRIYGSDYTAISASGAIRTKQDELAGLAGDGDVLLDGRYEIQTVRRWGNVAVANGHGVLKWKTATGTRDSNYNSVNVFEYRNGRWEYVAAFLP